MRLHYVSKSVKAMWCELEMSPPLWQCSLELIVPIISCHGPGTPGLLSHLHSHPPLIMINYGMLCNETDVEIILTCDEVWWRVKNTFSSPSFITELGSVPNNLSAGNNFRQLTSEKDISFYKLLSQKTTIIGFSFILKMCWVFGKVEQNMCIYCMHLQAQLEANLIVAIFI